MEYPITAELCSTVLGLVDAEPIDQALVDSAGKMCVEAAVCFALGLRSGAAADDARDRILNAMAAIGLRALQHCGKDIKVEDADAPDEPKTEPQS